MHDKPKRGAGSMLAKSKINNVQEIKMRNYA